MAAFSDRLEVIISANTARFDAALKRVQTRLKKFMAGSGVLLTFMKVAFVAAFAKAISVSAKFERSLVVVGTITQATSKQMKELSDAARFYGKNSEHGARKAAGGMKFLAMAGFDANEVMQAIPEVLKLATAAEIDVARAADIATNVMKGYGIETKNLADANNILVKAMTSANVDLEMLGTAFKFAGPVAKQAGISFQETTAIIAKMGDAGIQAGIAGRSLRMGLIKLLKPTNETQKALRRLGVTVRGSNGKIKSLVTVLGDLKRANAQAGDMAEIFGTRAGPAFAVLLRVGEEAMDDYIETLTDGRDVTKELVDMKLQTLAGKWNILKAAMEEFAIVVSDNNEGFKVIVDFFKDVVDWATKAIKKWRDFNRVAHIGKTDKELKRKIELMKTDQKQTWLYEKMKKGVRGVLRNRLKSLEKKKAALKSQGAAYKVLSEKIMHTNMLLETLDEWVAKSTKSWEDQGREIRFAEEHLESTIGAMLKTAAAMKEEENAIGGLTNKQRLKAALDKQVQAQEAERLRLSELLSSQILVEQGRLTKLADSLRELVNPAKEIPWSKLAMAHEANQAAVLRHADAIDKLNVAMGATGLSEETFKELQRQAEIQKLAADRFAADIKAKNKLDVERSQIKDQLIGKEIAQRRQLTQAFLTYGETTARVFADFLTGEKTGLEMRQEMFSTLIQMAWNALQKWIVTESTKTLMARTESQKRVAIYQQELEAFRALKMQEMSIEAQAQLAKTASVRMASGVKTQVVGAASGMAKASAVSEATTVVGANAVQAGSSQAKWWAKLPPPLGAILAMAMGMAMYRGVMGMLGKIKKHHSGGVFDASNQNMPGLNQDEGLAILQHGETIIPRGGGGAGGEVVVNYNSVFPQTQIEVDSFVDKMLIPALKRRSLAGAF